MQLQSRRPKDRAPESSPARPEFDTRYCGPHALEDDLACSRRRPSHSLCVLARVHGESAPRRRYGAACRQGRPCRTRICNFKFGSRPLEPTGARRFIHLRTYRPGTDGRTYWPESRGGTGLGYEGRGAAVGTFRVTVSVAVTALERRRTAAPPLNSDSAIKLRLRHQTRFNVRGVRPPATRPTLRPVPF